MERDTKLSERTTKLLSVLEDEDSFIDVGRIISKVN